MLCSHFDCKNSGTASLPILQTDPEIYLDTVYVFVGMILQYILAFVLVHPL